ncbi:MAG: DUF1214 domain-containing protein [Paracoccaceae bacterium]
MRVFYFTIAGAILGLFAGLASAILMSGITPGGLDRAETVSINRWVSDWSIGSEASGRYVKAWVARHGLLAMRKSEAVYFIRNVDDDGQPLTEQCQYRVSGGDLPSGWWSITLYDRLGYLPMNADAHLSVDATDATGAAWAFDVAATRPEGNTLWLSSAKAEGFDLTLRLYQPDQSFLDAPLAELGFPSVQRLSCDGEAGS